MFHGSGGNGATGQAREEWDALCGYLMVYRLVNVPDKTKDFAHIKGRLKSQWVPPMSSFMENFIKQYHFRKNGEVGILWIKLCFCHSSKNVIE